MIVTERLLFLRGSNPSLFLSGSYQGLKVKGDKEKHVVAYVRGEREKEVIVVTTRFFASSAIVGNHFWSNQSLLLPHITKVLLPSFSFYSFSIHFHLIHFLFPFTFVSIL